MSRPDSERALSIYKTFTRQTEEVVRFLGVARHFSSATRLEIPKLKHASTDLTRLLEDDLNDPDFDLRRREYLAGKGMNPDLHAASNRAPADEPRSATTSKPPQLPKIEQKLPPSDLIDFFESIEPNPQPVSQQNPYQQTGFQQQQPQQAFYQQQTGFPQQQQPQMTGFSQQNPYAGIQQQQPVGFQQQSTGFQQPQSTGNPFAQQQQQQNTGNPFGQPQAQALQPQSTGAGFGGYSPQPQSYGFQSNLGPIPQNGTAAFSQPQASQTPPTPSNPFRQSMLVSQHTGPAAAAPAKPLQRQNTNPFAKRLSMSAVSQPTGFNPTAQAPPVPQMPQSQSPQPLAPQRTGTNPFARNSLMPQPTGDRPQTAPLRPTATGTNPFRQSQFINQQTGQGWQTSGQNGTMGGLEHLDTMPVFPRPGMA